jgi:hypothetical protein
VQLNCPQGVRRQGVQRVVSESSGEVAFVLIPSECSGAQEPCKGCIGRGESQGCEPEQHIEGLLLQMCAEVEVFNI